MVKNQFGGSKSKKMGRKFLNAPVDRKLRLAEDEDEKYGVVTKLLGQGMVYTDVVDKSGTIEMICIIRKKFKGRGKRDNTLRIGSLILIGARSWEVIKDSSKPKCDLLEVYNDGEVNKLKKGGYVDSILSKITENTDDNILFEDAQTSKFKDIIEGNDNTSHAIIGQSNLSVDDIEDDEPFDVDDI
jgi:hypothetical protein